MSEKTEIEKAETQMRVAKNEQQVKAGTEDEVLSSGEVRGIIEIAVPDLMPSENVAGERKAKVERIKIPVRVQHVNVQVEANGYIVVIPQAGRSTPYGSSGSRHLFAGEHAKREMLEFIAQVIGQVTYCYREVVVGEDGEPVDSY